MMRTSRKTVSATRTALGVMLGAAILAAACGGGEKPPPGAAASGAPAAQVAAPGAQTPDAGGKIIAVQLVTDETGNYFKPQEIEARPTENTDGWLALPAKVPSGYAMQLNTGTPGAITFAPDSLQTQVAARLAKDRAALAGSATVSSAHVVVGPVWAVRLADGSALVMAQLRQTYLVTISKGQVQVDGDLAALAGRAAFGKQLTRTATEVVMFVVPVAGSSEPVRLIAAQKADVAATGS